MENRKGEETKRSNARKRVLARTLAEDLSKIAGGAVAWTRPGEVTLGCSYDWDDASAPCSDKGGTAL